MLTTGVELAHGGAVVVKRAQGGDAAIESLRREGERLRRATHPGVVGVVRSAPVAGGWELVLTHGGRPLAALGRLTPRTAGAIAASVAATVADLHDLGVVHGRIDGTHVLLGDQGRPVLCGFGDGSGTADPLDDVAAIGRLLSDLLGTDGDADPIPERRWLPRRGPRHGWERKALLAVADLAVSDPPERRPGARRLAAAIAAAVPGASLQPDASPATRSGEVGDPPAHLADAASLTVDDDGDDIERLRPAEHMHAAPALGRSVLLVGVAVAALVVVAGLRLRHDPPAPSSAASPAAVPSSSTHESEPEPRGPTRTARPVPGSVLVADGRRYRVGEPGDHLLVDDWWCQGEPTPAVLRPATDEVFVFRAWSPTEPIEITPTTTVPGADTLVSRRGADGCTELAARVGSELVPIDLGGAP